MRKRDLAVIAGAAVVTMIAASLVLSPLRPATAETRKQVQRPVTPSLTVDGVTYTLKLKQDAYQAGDQATLILKAVNATDKLMNVRPRVRMQMIGLGGMVSRRMIAVPKEVWSRECIIELIAGGTQTMELAPKRKLQAGSVVYFAIQVGRKSLARALTFSVPLLLESAGDASKS